VVVIEIAFIIVLVRRCSFINFILKLTRRALVVVIEIAFIIVLVRKCSHIKFAPKIDAPCANGRD